MGSSSSSRAGSPASARASEARVSSPPEKLSSGRSSCSSRKPRPCSGPIGADAPVPAAGVLEPGLGARVGAHHVLGPAAIRSSSVAQLLLQRHAGRRSRRARSRAASGRARAAGAGRAARSACPSRTPARRRRPRSGPRSSAAASSCPAPLRPASVMRSPRSSLNDTLRNSGLPAMSLSSADAITTATPDSRLPALCAAMTSTVVTESLHKSPTGTMPPSTLALWALPLPDTEKWRARRRRRRASIWTSRRSLRRSTAWSRASSSTRSGSRPRRWVGWSRRGGSRGSTSACTRSATWPSHPARASSPRCSRAGRARWRVTARRARCMALMRVSGGRSR